MKLSEHCLYRDNRRPLTTCGGFLNTKPSLPTWCKTASATFIPAKPQFLADNTKQCENLNQITDCLWSQRGCFMWWLSRAWGSNSNLKHCVQFNESMAVMRLLRLLWLITETPALMFCGWIRQLKTLKLWNYNALYFEYKKMFPGKQTLWKSHYKRLGSDLFVACWSCTMPQPRLLLKCFIIFKLCNI